MGQRHDEWPASVVEGVAAVLGATDDGLTGSEMGRLLERSGIEDPFPDQTKRHRLYEALWRRQTADRASNCVIRFVSEAMAPVRYKDEPSLFAARQGNLNEVLVHVGLRLNDEGKVQRGAKASTLSEAAIHADSIRLELRRRGTHPEVVRFCTAELLAKNNFHAILEATKSVADRLRALSGETSDGAGLVDAALASGRSGTPRLAINSGRTQSERDEQNGLANLCKGMFGMFRNPVAHDPRITRPVSDDHLLEALTTLSLIHRRLDAAVDTRAAARP